MNTQEQDRAEQQAKAQLESIVEMVAALDTEDEKAREDAEQAIQEDPLSVEVRKDWYTPGSEDDKPTEFNILLCTGGPAVRIIGSLDQYCQPDEARLEYQDWFTCWTVLHGMTDAQSDALLTYCQQFYYGE
jgi:hypothetical protein